MNDDENWHDKINKRQGELTKNNHRSFVLWFTGLSASGKSTLANAIEKHLLENNHNVIVLDGDKLRQGLCSDLEYTKADRHENMRRVGELVELLMENGSTVLAAFISPYKDDREQIRSRFAANEFFEVYCKCDLSVCEKRDIKGLYARARNNEIKNFTGISAPYEAPVEPEIIVNTKALTIDESVRLIIEQLKNRRVLN